MHCYNFPSLILQSVYLQLISLSSRIHSNFAVMRLNQRSWEAMAAEKRAATISKIPESWRLSETDLSDAKGQRDLTAPFICKFLTEDEVAITAQNTTQIASAIQDGHLTAVQVTTAFCKRAAIAHQINNCLHEIFFDQAIERAKQLDAYFAQHSKTCGPLHGVPVSLKDQFHVRDIDTTMGYVGWIGSNLGIKHPEQSHRVESQITTELLGLGAVLYCKTSLPQTLLFGETKNNIIGETLNPLNQNLSCGGSSGGEGALQALGGSTLGVGTDIGGSRISYREVANTNPGQNTYRSTVGFLSTSLDGLELVFSSVLSTKPWLRDPAVAPIPFRKQIVEDVLSRAEHDGTAKTAAKPLKLGILWTDGQVGTHPPVTRGLHLVVHAVKEAGHKLAFLKADGAHDIHAQLDRSGEPLIPDLKRSFELRPPIGLLEYQDLTLQGLDYEAQYSDYWNSTGDGDGQVVDAVIMPVAPHAAVIPGKFYHTAYTEAMNLLNYSAVVIPVTKADKDLDAVNESYQPLNDIDQKNWDAYDPEIYHGGPVGVQIVGRKFEEEKTWAIAKIVTAALNTQQELH
ncbi:amidase [Apiospora sp. TS-2023a]